MSQNHAIYVYIYMIKRRAGIAQMVEPLTQKPGAMPTRVRVSRAASISLSLSLSLSLSCPCLLCSVTVSTPNTHASDSVFKPVGGIYIPSPTSVFKNIFYSSTGTPASLKMWHMSVCLSLSSFPPVNFQCWLSYGVCTALVCNHMYDQHCTLKV